jgi:hypothetical protein
MENAAFGKYVIYRGPSNLLNSSGPMSRRYHLVHAYGFLAGLMRHKVWLKVLPNHKIPRLVQMQTSKQKLPKHLLQKSIWWLSWSRSGAAVTTQTWMPAPLKPS